MNAFAQRLRSRTVPPSAHGSRAFEARERESLQRDGYDADLTGWLARVDVIGGTYTVRDLQERVAREDSER